MIPGIVLAGGQSSRMGRPKALLPLNVSGERFIDRIAATLLAAGVHEIFIIVGADAEAIRAAFHPPAHVRIVDNPEHQAGQLTSLVAGLRAIEHDAAAALVTLVDVPLVADDTVRQLLAAYREHRAPIVRPVSKGRHGHPVIFDRSVFDDLLHADPSVGAKSVVRAHSAGILAVTVEDEGAFTDIDTPEDYARIVSRS